MGERQHLLNGMATSAQATALRALYALPKSARRALAGRPTRLAGRQLDPDMQLFLKLQRLSGRNLGGGDSLAARRALEEGDAIIRGRLVEPVTVRDLRIPSPHADDPMAARLYTPEPVAPRSGLLVFYHGGGWVVGSLESHDNVCRFLARHSGVRVLSVAYRLAPEHQFPAAADDALAAFQHAASHADELGVDPAAIAVGGDSAGGNLAIAAALGAAEAGGVRPAYQLLFYPATDHTTFRRSRELFGEGLFLTDASMTWFANHYVGGANPADPRISVLLAPNLAQLPPAYLAVAGFDPLCDEGEAFAKKLAEAGVEVTFRCFDDLIHGYANFFGFSKRAREALGDAALALHRAVGMPRHDVLQPDAQQSL
ncbi:MAG: alpha/beta hydrolase [Micromonosporaceae bacterium]